MCKSAAQGSPINGEGTLSGYFLNSNFQTISQAGTGKNDTTVEDCGENVHRILTALFNINNMGANIYNNEISDSNPLLILSPSVTLPGDLFDEDFQEGYKFMGIQNGLFSATFTVVEN